MKNWIQLLVEPTVFDPRLKFFKFGLSIIFELMICIIYGLWDQYNLWTRDLYNLCIVISVNSMNCEICVWFMDCWICMIYELLDLYDLWIVGSEWSMDCWICMIYGLLDLYALWIVGSVWSMDCRICMIYGLLDMNDLWIVGSV